MTLIVSPNIEDPDGFYEELIASQRDCTDDEAAKINARLILLLANHIGEREVLSEAIRIARTRQPRGDERLP